MCACFQERKDNARALHDSEYSDSIRQKGKEMEMSYWKEKHIDKQKALCLVFLKEI